MCTFACLLSSGMEWCVSAVRKIIDNYVVYFEYRDFY